MGAPSDTTKVTKLVAIQSVYTHSPLPDDSLSAEAPDAVK